MRYSLKAGYLSQAKLKAWPMAGMTQRLFADLRKRHPVKKLADKQIMKITAAYLQKRVETSREPEPFGGEGMNPLYAAVERTNVLAALRREKDSFADDLEAGDDLATAATLPEIQRNLGVFMAAIYRCRADSSTDTPVTLFL